MGVLRKALEAQLGGVVARPAVVELCFRIADGLDAAEELDDKLLREYRLALSMLFESAPESGESAADRLEREFAELDPTVEG